MKKIIHICMIITLFIMPQKTDAKIGDIAGHTLFTDITAYINNYPIPSYNLNNNTVVLANELKGYGFSVAWDETHRRVSISRSNANKIKPIRNVYKNSLKLGRPAKTILQTDIKTFINGNLVKSFNIDGCTAIYLDDLASFGHISWDNSVRAISLSIPGLPSTEFRPVPENPYYKAVALTFDDGPSEYTHQILDTLEKYNASATFFIVGCRISIYQDTILRMKDLGMEIGNHTYDHTILTELSNESIIEQKNKTNDELWALTGQPVTLFRPPCSLINDNVLSNFNMSAILWSLDTADWASSDPESIVNTVMNKVKDGDIIIMHDLSKTSEKAAVRLIPLLSEAGFKISSVGELAKERNIKLERGVCYSELRQ